MYKKKLNPKPHRNRYSIAVYVDGREYPSLLSATIDFEIGYPNVFQKIKKNNGAPITVSGHEIVLKSWIQNNPDYKLQKREVKDE